MITVDRYATRHRHIGRRIEETAAHYGSLAARKLGGTLPRVRILVTDKTGMVRTACQADADLTGDASRIRRACNTAGSWWYDRHAYGVTVYDKRGILVVINSSSYQGQRELDRTVIHELTHAVQLGAPGVRDQHATYTRMRLGVIPPVRHAVTAYMWAMDTREQQAHNLEALA